MPTVLTEVLDLAVRVEGDAARAAAVLEAAEGALARAEARVLALPPAERVAPARRMMAASTSGQTTTAWGSPWLRRG